MTDSCLFFCYSYKKKKRKIAVRFYFSFESTTEKPSACEARDQFEDPN